MYAGLTIVHIVAGTLGLVSGFGAFLAPKGRPVHVLAGRVFVASMLVMSGLGGGLAVFEPDRASVVAGMVTFYLVLTSWLTVSRAPGHFDLLNWGAVALAVGTAAAGVVFGLEALNSPTGLIDGIPPQPVFVFAGLATLGALLDLSLLPRRGVRGRHRLARHLWRMGIAMVIAAAAFFLGQQQVFPEAWQGLWLGLPVLLVLFATLGWLGMTLAGRLPGTSATRSAG